MYNENGSSVPLIRMTRDAPRGTVMRKIKSLLETIVHTKGKRLYSKGFALEMNNDEVIRLYIERGSKKEVVKVFYRKYGTKLASRAVLYSIFKRKEEEMKGRRR